MEDLYALADWEITKNDAPIAIAGPCSAESEEQLLETCLEINKHIDITLFRAGIWKPRTRPGSFEGVGAIGLKWIQGAKKILQKPFTVEVATAEHVELALRHDIDVLWLGARTTVNPFLVQDIADALRGVDIPVIVKNPINPDLALWIGAMERIYNAGIKKIAALHRGFSSHEPGKYRNLPIWSLAISLKSKLPKLPLLCDPSHIGGNRHLIYPISQKAIDLNYDGLMIETHIRPNKARSDAKQQVTPRQLAEILNSIKIRKNKSDSLEFNNQLHELRLKIDRADQELLEILTTRMEYVKEIGTYKYENNVTAFQAERWIEVCRTRPQWAVELGLHDAFVEQLFKLIHDESIRIQHRILSVNSPETHPYHSISGE